MPAIPVYDVSMRFPPLPPTAANWGTGLEGQRKGLIVMLLTKSRLLPFV